MPLIADEQLYREKLFRYSYDGVTYTNGTPSSERSRFFRKETVGTGKRLKPLVLDQTPYTADIEKATMPYGVSSTYDPPYWYPWGIWEQWIGPFDGQYPYGWNPASVKDQLVNEALIDALTKLKDQKFNAGVAMAEAQGLADMLQGVGKGYLRTREKFLDKDFKGAYKMFQDKFKDALSWESFKDSYGDSLSRAERLKKVPNSWLYYHFGIKPTLNDMDGALQEWLDRFDGKPEGMTSVVRGQARYTTHRTGQTDFGSLLRAEDMLLEVEESVQIRLEVRLRDAFAAKMSRLGVTNVPEALWNRGPWTWAADYFVSFGQWLSVLDAGTGWDFGITTQSHRVRYRASCKHFTRKGQLADVTPYRYKRIVLNRQIYGNIVPPTWRVVPKLKLKGISDGKIANLLSAIVGSFSHGRGR